jgi:hypothetical protein
MKEEEVMPECNLWTWRNMSEGDLFKLVRKNVNARFRWDIKTARVSYPPFYDYINQRGWLTPIGFALAYNRQSLIGRLLKNGVDVNAPCVGFFDKTTYTLRPIELLQYATKSEFLVLKRNPSVEFYVNDAALSFCRWFERFPAVATYIRQKRMYALCFCLRELGGLWPDIAWIIKDLL